MRLMTASAFFLVAGCALVESPGERAAVILAEASLVSFALPDDRMVAFGRGARAERLTIYLESDGAPWPWPDEPPSDPTPVVPTVVRMAAADRAPAVAYVGRPCQYLRPDRLAVCDPAFWTLGRFSEAAVAMTNAAVEELRRRHGASRIDLVGYSGGGAMAVLVASRRSDVSCLVTVAAPLDIDAWTVAKQVTPLYGSLNPTNFPLPTSVRQTHFRGVQDQVVPLHTISRYLAQAPHSQVVDVPRYGHDCCWAGNWSELLKQSCLRS
ncbi:MAG: alpha/beta hydrolase [Burkholderiales bacterium]|nr:alpha/beta hydrolase [Burkholderiales bacterium]